MTIFCNLRTESGPPQHIINLSLTATHQTHYKHLRNQFFQMVENFQACLILITLDATMRSNTLNKRWRTCKFICTEKLYVEKCNYAYQHFLEEKNKCHAQMHLPIILLKPPTHQQLCPIISQFLPPHQRKNHHLTSEWLKPLVPLQVSPCLLGVQFRIPFPLLQDDNSIPFFRDGLWILGTNCTSMLPLRLLRDRWIWRELYRPRKFDGLQVNVLNTLGYQTNISLV